MRARIPLEARDGERSGGFEHGARVFEDVLDCRTDFVNADRYAFVEIAAAQLEGLLAHCADRDAVGEESDVSELDAASGADRMRHRGRIVGLNADNLDLWPHRLYHRGDSAGETAAADRNENRSAVGLTQQFERDRRVARDHVG